MASDDDGAAWSGRANDLADWAWERLVNRHDVWGGYGRVKGVHTRPAKTRRGQETLTKEILRRHFWSAERNDIIGLHTTSPDNTSLWGAVDIDRHQEEPSLEVTSGAAAAWYDALRNGGFTPLLTQSDGTGGYHLRVLFAEPAPTALVYDFLKRLTRDYAARGFAKQPETFRSSAV